MSLTDEERMTVVNYRLEKARITMEQLKNLVPLGYWDIIANRLYYAAYYAVSALLLQTGHTAQTHHDIIHLFGLHFIKTSLLDNRYGSLYSQLFSLRQTGDYGDTFGLTQEQVEPLIQPTEEMIARITSIVNKTKNTNSQP